MSSGKEHESKEGRAVVVTGRAAANSIKLFLFLAFLNLSLFSLSLLI
jgi:hypothetical protein